MTPLALLLSLVACKPGGIVVTHEEDTGETAPIEEETDEPIEIVDGTDDTADTDTDTDTDTTVGGDDDDAIYAAFFDPATIQTVDLVLSDRAIRTLNFGGDEYVQGDVTINGVFFSEVGVRLKGSSTYEDLDCDDGYCKAAFKIKLNEFVEDQRYGDLERITLNNMTSDYTQSKEVIVYNLLNEHNQLASRCNYARVTLNGEAWGLYANVESADDRWLKRRFEDPEGNFWGTASYYGDFYTPYLDTGWVPKSGDGSLAQLEAVTAALDSFAGDFFGELAPVVNVSQWLEYWAWCAATGNYDGYPFTLNDVLVYADPANEGRLVFAPWGTDESWDEYEVSGRNWNLISGRLASACLADVACIAELKVQIGVAIAAYETSDVPASAQAAWDLSEADAQSDPRRPFTPDYVWYYRDYYKNVMPGYGDYVRRQVGL
ncbi:MAG: CotH kinase family protein [Pseudomonadota bacterium]|nr:CotH kinase family protein [Pseudomonadota bacterium]